MNTAATQQINENNHIIGTEYNDSIDGHEGDDTLEGRSGNDRIEGGAGNDAILGGNGNDKLIGGAGFDFLNGGDGFDTATYGDSFEGISVDLRSGRGSGGTAEGDTLVSIEGIRGSDFNDTIIGNDEANTLIGEDGDDSLFGMDGNDMLFDFGNGNDLLDGGKGNDVILGSSGNNIIVGGKGNDYLKAGSGVDTFEYALGDGSDRIADFDFNRDFVNLLDIGFTPELIMDLLVVDGNNVVLDLSQHRGSGENDTITFVNVNIEDFHADLFVTETAIETRNSSYNDMPSEEIYEEEIATIEQTAPGLEYSVSAIESIDFRTDEYIDYNTF
jgi:Ca2+-binding RTX toxin-like protein